MLATAQSNSASVAALSAGASPTIVKTDRLWDESDEKSSSRTPGVSRIAAAIRWITSGRRPSLTFGIDSIIGIARL